MYDIFKISIATTQLNIGQLVCSLNNVVFQKILFCTSAFHYCLHNINVNLFLDVADKNDDSAQPWNIGEILFSGLGKCVGSITALPK